MAITCHSTGSLADDPACSPAGCSRPGSTPRWSRWRNRDRYVGDWIARSGRFALNQVAIGGKALIRHFGRGHAADAPAFEGLTLRDEMTARGGPILEGAMAFLDAEVVGQLAGGDHRSSWPGSPPEACSIPRPSLWSTSAPTGFITEGPCGRALVPPHDRATVVNPAHSTPISSTSKIKVASGGIWAAGR